MSARPRASGIRGRSSRPSDRRGQQRDPGGGLSGDAVPSEPLAEVLYPRVWFRLALGQMREYQLTIFQPVGGIDMIAKAFPRGI